MLGPIFKVIQKEITGKNKCQNSVTHQDHVFCIDKCVYCEAIGTDKTQD
jgi:hypothetical protein